VRYAFLSDIHANLAALEVAFARLLPDDVVICPGDLIGYGANPNECVALMRERALHTVMGNHDEAGLDLRHATNFNRFALEAIRWTNGVLLPEHRAWLATLPYELRIADFLLVHGSPNDPRTFKYIMGESGADAGFGACDDRLIFVGHTHVAGYFERSPSGLVLERRLPYGGTFVLQSECRYIVNVGSIGQPRDHNADPALAFYEPATQTVTIERFSYSIERAQASIRAAGLPEELAARLERGR
jgi:diadenosine tetraphosphatase ApaH/serine/threonine PP2A family protein phosphatase